MGAKCLGTVGSVDAAARFRALLHGPEAALPLDEAALLIASFASRDLDVPAQPHPARHRRYLFQRYLHRAIPPPALPFNTEYTEGTEICKVLRINCPSANVIPIISVSSVSSVPSVLK